MKETTQITQNMFICNSYQLVIYLWKHTKQILPLVYKGKYVTLGGEVHSAKTHWSN